MVVRLRQCQNRVYPPPTVATEMYQQQLPHPPLPGLVYYFFDEKREPWPTRRFKPRTSATTLMSNHTNLDHVGGYRVWMSVHQPELESQQTVW